MKRHGFAAREWLLLLLLLAVAWQAAFVGKDYLVPWAKRAWRMGDTPALQRSAAFGFGTRFASYMAFLRDTIPDEAIVVRSSQRIGGPTSHEGIMQFFLFPRKITNCSVTQSFQECYQTVGGPRTYFLAVGDYPEQEDVEDALELIPFDLEGFYRGVYAPEEMMSK